MTDSYMLSIPTDLYDRARQIAEETEQPVEKVLLDHLEEALSDDELDDALPRDIQAELDAFAFLSDDILWMIVREQLSPKTKARMQTLMERNSLRIITDEEHVELTELAEQGDKLMLRKAHAAALLTDRGYKVTPRDMSGRNG